MSRGRLLAPRRITDLARKVDDELTRLERRPVVLRFDAGPKRRSPAC